MTEGDWNLVVRVIEGRLTEGISYGARCASVDAKWLARTLVDNERLRRRETELQADNTRLHLKAEAALNREHNLMREVDALRDVLGQGDGSKALAQRDEAMLKARIAEQGYEGARAVLADVTKERDEARALNGEMAAKLDRAKADSDAASRTIGNLTRERDQACHKRDEAEGLTSAYRKALDRIADVLGKMPGEITLDAAERVVRERNDATAALVAANASIAECRQALLDAQREMVSVTESRDVLALWRAIPPELVRLYKVARKSLSMHGTAAQMSKLAEECGEYVAEHSRLRPRYSDPFVYAERVRAEIHDVLTVALSLCEPALMAKAAERLEGRLA